MELIHRSWESQASPDPLQSALGPAAHPTPWTLCCVGSPVPAVGRWVFSGARGSPTGHQSGACWLQSPRPSSLPCGLGGGHHGAGRIRAGVAASPGCHFQGVGLPGPPPSRDARLLPGTPAASTWPVGAGPSLQLPGRWERRWRADARATVVSWGEGQGTRSGAWTPGLRPLRRRAHP